MTDAEGQIVWQAKYRPWGVIEKLVVNEVEQNLRFQGQYFDVETGLHYNTFRYYDPEIGRFITQDPIGLAGGVNLYQYAPNPIRWTDALGWACELFRGVSANHPAIDDAKRGVARPGKIDSDISPASHNGGDVSDISSYTSWTRDLEIAKWWANRQGPGGVILGTPTGAPKPGDTWRWEFSPDEYGESEILLKGIRDKLQVFTPDEL